MCARACVCVCVCREACVFLKRVCFGLIVACVLKAFRRMCFEECVLEARGLKLSLRVDVEACVLLFLFRRRVHVVACF